MISPLNRGVSQGGGAAPSGNQVVALRVAIIGAVLLGLFAIVFFRLWFLQVLSGQSLAAEASQNRTRPIAITAPRGEIVDREGRTIVRNKRAQIVEIAPGSLPMLEREVANKYGQDLGEWSDKVQQQVINKYGAEKAEKLKKTPEWAIKAVPKPQITPLNNPELVRDYADEGKEGELASLTKRYEKLGWLLDLEPSEVRRRVIKSLYLLPYANIALRKNGADEDVVNYIAENQEEFPGVTVTAKTVRSYPHHEAGAQLFGQVGPVPVGADGKSTIKKYRKLNTAAQVGLNGLELQYDGNLRGRDGQVIQRIDAFGNVTDEPKISPPVSGDKLQLTLDLPLQVYTQEILGGMKSKFNPSNHPGAAIALDPRDGQILAMASNPSFDPSDFVRGLTDEEFKDYIDESGGKPLFNRVTDGGYAGGSTFKPVTAFAAIAEGKATPGTVIQDNGKIEIGGQPFQNAGATPNGPVDLVKSMKVSSDIYYYQMGAYLNDRKREPLQAWAKKLGFGQRTGIDLPGENRGTIPGVAWRKELYEQEKKCRESKSPKIPLGLNYNVYAAAAQGCGLSDMRPWSIGDNVQLAIGQGDVGITPLQNAVMYAAIQNGGKIVRPHLAKAVQDPSGATRQTFQFKAKRTEDLAATGALEGIREGLRQAAEDPGGTSYPVFENWPKDKYPIYGKTGTAQKQGKQDQSWYACYVNDPKNPLVVVVTVEDGGFGAETAAPIAAQMLAKYYGVNNAEIKAGDSSTR